MSLLASIRNIVRSEEDLATAALAHVLQTHDAVAEAFNEFVGVTTGVTWSTQEHLDDGEGARGRPDLVARSGGSNQAFVEAKFWAGLTAAQPNLYLRMLENDGVLVFLVPETRLAYVEREVLRRAGDIALDVARTESEAGTPSHAAVTFEAGGRRHVRFVAWSSTLRVLLEAATKSGLELGIADLRQIESLVAAIEGEAFVPFSSEQLTSGEIPHVALQIRDVLRGLHDALVSVGFRRVGKLSSLVSGWTGVSVERDGLRWSVFESWKTWQRFGHSPIWLTLDESDRSEQGHLLAAWSDEEVFGQVNLSHWNPPTVAVPIMIPPHADRQEVIDSMVEQVESLIRTVIQRREVLMGSSET